MPAASLRPIVLDCSIPIPARALLVWTGSGADAAPEPNVNEAPPTTGSAIPPAPLDAWAETLRVLQHTLDVRLDRLVAERIFTRVYRTRGDDGRTYMATVVDPSASSSTRARFQQSAWLMFSHGFVPGVLRVGDLPSDRNAYFHEHWVGTVVDLDALRLPIARKIALFREVVCSLGALHERGQVHGALCPQNVVLDTDFRPRLDEIGFMDVGRTLLGDLGNTHGYGAYAAPEVRKALDYDHRADVFSLGKLLEFIITGRQPSESPPQRSASCRSDRELPEALCRVIRRCTAAVAAERFQSAGEILEALGAWNADRPSVANAPRERRRGARAALFGILLALVVGAALVAALRTATRVSAPNQPGSGDVELNLPGPRSASPVSS